MEIYKLVEPLKNEPIYDSLIENIDRLYYSDNPLDSAMSFGFIHSMLMTLGIYEKFSFEDYEKVSQELLKLSSRLKFKNYKVVPVN